MSSSPSIYLFLMNLLLLFTTIIIFQILLGSIVWNNLVSHRMKPEDFENYNFPNFHTWKAFSFSLNRINWSRNFPFFLFFFLKLFYPFVIYDHQFRSSVSIFPVYRLIQPFINDFHCHLLYFIYVLWNFTKKIINCVNR